MFLSSMDANFSSYKCEDPLDKICEIPLPFYPPRETKETDLTPWLQQDPGILPVIKKVKGTSQKSFIDDVLYANAMNQLRQVNSLEKDELNRRLKNYDPYFSLGDKSPATRGIPDKNTLDMYAIYEVFGFPEEKELRYMTLGDGPGNWTRFIQKKYPLSYGYGMTLVSDGDWDFSLVDPRRFQVLYGNSVTGDIKKERDWLIDFVLAKSARLDVIACNTNYKDIETLVAEVIIALSLLKSRVLETIVKEQTQPLSLEEIEVGIVATNKAKIFIEGGMLILRLEDSISEITGQIIYLISRCFSEVTIYKPAVGNQNAMTKYLVCKNFIDANEILTILKEIRNDTRSVLTELPVIFNNWLTHINNKLYKRLSDLCNMILTYPETPRVEARDSSRMMLLLELNGTTGFSIY